MKKIKSQKSVRLPSHISPTVYNLTIKPDLESFTFSGNETIKVKILKETKEITLHSKDLDIETVKISSQEKVAGSKRKKEIHKFADKISYDIKNETATFYFKNKIKKGNAELSIVFSGIINDNLRGFYKSKYTENGKDKFMATTQFEATDARRAFPCFDEPAHKAIFEVSLVIPKNHTAISNTLPIEIKEHDAGYKIVSFSPTPKMSTYLLAFIIGEFEYVEGFTKDKIQVRVFTTSGKKHQAKFALEVAIKSLEFYNEYFDIPYPLPNLDLIAIPDFESAAMENWGAVTFRETAILVDEEKTSLSNKQWVAIVIAHELAHQWFGNLVTMHWWTDLWLNEGFASYMETFCIDKLFPNWHMWNLYIADRYSVALRLDSLKNSHPIEIEVHHPNEINEIFDTVSYAKGSVVIRMLAEYLGEEKFRDGLRYYLKNHSYKNTKTVDLWSSFEKVSGKPIKKIMKTWTRQTGYPLVQTSSGKSSLSLHQERFFSSRVSKKYSKEKPLWQIPIKISGKNILLSKKNRKINENTSEKINKGETSFVRVNYDQKTLSELKNNITKLPTADRLAIIRDLFALAEGGYIKTDIALGFSLAYKNENEYIVWVELISGINRIFNILVKNLNQKELEEKYKKYALSLLSPLLNKVSWNPKENEPHHTTFLRNLIIGTLAHYGHKEVVQEAKKLFDNKDKKPIRADIRGVIYNIIAKNGGTKEWKLFAMLYQEEKMHEEKDRLGIAMTQFKNKKLLQKTLAFAMSKSVKQQDAPFMIGSVWTNTEGRDLTWKFIKSNWDNILKRYGEGGHFLSRLLGPLGGHIDLKDLKDAKKFFKKNNAPGAERTLLQSYEKIESNSAWLHDDKKAIKDWLERNF